MRTILMKILKHVFSHKRYSEIRLNELKCNVHTNRTWEDYHKIASFFRHVVEIRPTIDLHQVSIDDDLIFNVPAAIFRFLFTTSDSVSSARY